MEENPEIVRAFTQAVREADEEFENSGGSSRHYVSECLLPALAKAGLSIRRTPSWRRTFKTLLNQIPREIWQPIFVNHYHNRYLERLRIIIVRASI